MCLSHPMKVLTVENQSFAICDHNGAKNRVDISFVDDVREGEWLTVHIGIAREKISEKDAKIVSDALQALEMVKAGETDIDHLFADLIDREPYCPPQPGESAKKA